MPFPTTEVAVIGAGPYGLAAAAHLRASGKETTVFGQPMEFWDQQMPAGMFLRSAWYACDISHPSGHFSLSDFRTREKQAFSAPVPLESFVRYGQWFQRQLLPDLDRRRVTRIEKNGSFRLSLSDGETLSARRVVVAAGISPFAQRPPEFDNLSRKLVSHSTEHRDQGYPRLDLGLESSIEGLHFMGAPAARSFGPLVRFVSGTGYSARALTEAIVRSSRGRS